EAAPHLSVHTGNSLQRRSAPRSEPGKRVEFRGFALLCRQKSSSLHFVPTIVTCPWISFPEKYSRTVATFRWHSSPSFDARLKVWRGRCFLASLAGPAWE